MKAGRQRDERKYWTTTPLVQLKSEFRTAGTVRDSSARVKFSTEKTSMHLAGCQIMVPFWVPIIIRQQLFRVPKRDPNY